MNAHIKLLDRDMLANARALAGYHDTDGRSGTAVALRALVAEVETLREAAKGALFVVNQAGQATMLAQLKASVLLMITEKIAPVIDDEIEQRQQSGCAENWAPLQALSNELHGAIRLAKG
jgi:hypothetical protein